MESLAFYAHSNMYVVLIGPAGSKKSTAIRAGKKLLKKVPGINMSSDAPSVVGLMKDFESAKLVSKEHQSVNAFIGEMSSLFENASDTMTGFLTAIYDGDDDYIKRTRIGGDETIPRPWLNLLAATTPTWLGDNLTKSAVEGGMVARTLYIYSDERIYRSPFPRLTPALRQLETDLIHDLGHISQLNGEFDFAGGTGGDAYSWFDAWYRDGDARMPRVLDNRTAGYFVRKPMHLLKVAMAVSLSGRDDKLLTQDDLITALAFLDAIEPGMKRAFSSVGGNEWATDQERIEAQIEGAGKAGMSYGEVVAANYHNVAQREIDAILNNLRHMNRLKRTISGESAHYFSTRFSSNGR